MGNKSTGYRIFSVANNLLMVLILFACIYPFLYMLSLSLSNVKPVIEGKVFLYPMGFNLDAYKTILSYPNFFIAYRNTVFYTFAGSFIALFMTIIFAYPLSKTFLKGRGFIMNMVIFTMFFTGGIIPNFLVVSSLRLTDTVLAYLLPFAISPFNLIILINFFMALPDSIEEAALIDGMSYIGILAKIIIPLSKPAIATITLFIAVFFWNDWFYGLIYMSNNSLYPVMLVLRNIVAGSSILGASAGSASQDQTVVYSTLKASASILTAVPIIIFYPFLQRYFITGLTIGSVKG